MKIKRKEKGKRVRKTYNKIDELTDLEVEQMEEEDLKYQASLKENHRNRRNLKAKDKGKRDRSKTFDDDFVRVKEFKKKKKKERTESDFD